jgi:hypothetical protein
MMGLGKKPQGKATQHPIKRGIGKVQLLGAHVMHLDMLPSLALNVRRGLSYHIFCQVDAHRMSVRPHLIRCGKQHRSPVGDHV